jgi:hypothetical protein
MTLVVSVRKKDHGIERSYELYDPLNPSDAQRDIALMNRPIVSPASPLLFVQIFIRL